MQQKQSVDMSNYDFIGFGCQVLGFGVPYIVKKFLRTLPQGKNKEVFIFRTAGGVAPINYNASNLMKRILSHKGYRVFHERLFAISSNWINRFDDEVIRKLHEATKRKTEVMCKELVQGKSRVLKTGLGLKVLMGFLSFFSTNFFRVISFDMETDNNCNGCRVCVKSCPNNNISMKNNEVKFKLSCNCCLRCVYACPQNSIHFKLFSSYPVKGGYNIKKILNQESNSKEGVKPQEPPFLKRYVEDEAY